MNRGYGKVGINESGCSARPRLDVGSSMMLRMRKNNLGFAVVFTDDFCGFDGCKWLFSQTPPSLRATAPNLGEEFSYLARWKANNKLIS